MRAQMDLFARSITIAAVFSAVHMGCGGGADLSGYHSIQKTGSPSKIDESAGDRVSDVSDVSDSSHTRSIESDATLSLEELPVSALAPVNVVDGADMAVLLKLAPKESDGSTTGDGKPPASSDKPRVAEVLIPEKTFQFDSHSKALRVSYDDLDLLKVLNLEPVTENATELMPDWLKHLNGQRIKIRGFMYPTYEAEGIERFVLARDNQICCFGRDPKVYDLVQVDMKRGKTTNYIPPTRSFDVVGRFKIEMGFEDGKPYGLYYIEDAQVVDR